MIRELVVGLVGLVLLASALGCGGSLSPLYSDFRIDERPTAGETDSVAVARTDSSTASRHIQAEIQAALQEVGWELDEAPSDNAVSTTEVEIVDWGLYEVRVSLDVVPINQKFVRVYVHPYRQYFFGARSKMSYLNRRVRTYVFPELSQALRARGIVPLGESQTAEAEEDRDDSADETQEVFSSSSGPDR